MLEGVKFAWGITAVFVVVTVALGQLPAHEYLIDVTGPDFPVDLRAAGVTPIAHDGDLWAVRAEDENSLRKTTEITGVTRAASVIIELKPGSQRVAQSVREAGGIVTRTFQSRPILAAVLPANKVLELQSLPGVKRIRKSRSYSAFRVTH
jgi:hypothetical protein